MLSKTVEIVCPSWRIYFINEPNIIVMSDNRFMLSGKCRECFGNGRIYVRGDYEKCRTCNGSVSGNLTFIVSPTKFK